MRHVSVVPLVVGLGALLGCSSVDSTVDSPATIATQQADLGAVAHVTGSGHVLRDLGGGEELTTFSYSAIAHSDGTASGEYQYQFRAADFFIHGTVTCVTVAGNQGWIGGTLDRVTSDDPEDQTLVGTDIWWRVEDNGEGGDGAADRTSSLLFTLPGVPITAASWCHDQPVRGVMRDVVGGNIQVR